MDDHRERSRSAPERAQHYKAAAVRGDIVKIRRPDRNQACREQEGRRGGSKAMAARFDIHHHHLAFQRKEEEFFSIAAPTRLLSTGGRNLPFFLDIGTAADSLGSIDDIGFVRPLSLEV